MDRDEDLIATTAIGGWLPRATYPGKSIALLQHTPLTADTALPPLSVTTDAVNVR